jgi:Tfp pilus assembly protein PilO
MKSLSQMAPNAKRAAFVTIAISALAIVLYMFGVQPCIASLEQTKQDIEQLEGKKRGVDRDLRDSAKVKDQLEQLDAAIVPYEETMLTPLLESWAMRAKSKLDPLAADVGLKVVDYAEMPVRALPLPNPVPKQLYARRPIRVTARGTYAEIASFVLRVEKMLPYVSLQALNIKVQKTPETQTAEIVLEWPVKGALSTPVVPGGVKR